MNVKIYKLIKVLTIFKQNTMFNFSIESLTTFNTQSFDYPGDWVTSHVEEKASAKNASLYETRITLWRSSTKKEVGRILCGFLRGIKARKDVTLLHRKEKHIEEATKRVSQRNIDTKVLTDRILELEKENADLLASRLHQCKFSDKIKSEIEEMIHVRQIHHLRKTKLI